MPIGFCLKSFAIDTMPLGYNILESMLLGFNIFYMLEIIPLGFNIFHNRNHVFLKNYIFNIICFHLLEIMPI